MSANNVSLCLKIEQCTKYVGAASQSRLEKVDVAQFTRRRLCGIVSFEHELEDIHVGALLQCIYICKW